MSGISDAARRDVARADWVLNVLGLMFIAFKLTHVIDWSWWWVTAPFWGPAAVIIAIVVVLLLVAGLFGGLAKVLDRFDR